MRPTYIATLLAILLLTTPSHARILFIDNTLAADCATYDPATRSCGAGSYRAFKTIRGGADVAVAGDTVVLRAGSYNEQLAPKASGAVDHPIVFAAPNGEQAVITGAALAPAIWLHRVSYINIQGIIVSDVQRWMAVLGSHHITIRSNIFRNANDAGGSSKTGLFFQESDYNVVRGNLIENSTQDNLALVQSSHNLVEGNRITRAAHTLWAIKCGSYNVLRGNYFHNELEKIGEIYDCDGVGYGDAGFAKVTSLDDTKHNVVEGNAFAYTATPVDASPYAGIQHAGQGCIIRGNVFFHCIGPPIDLTLYADEARYNYGNRIYNNVFYDNRFGGMAVSGVQGSNYRFADNTCLNNIFLRNRFSRFDTRWAWYATLDGKPVQIISGRVADVRFERNDIFNATADELWTIAYGDRTAANNPPPQPLSWWEANRPAMFAGNMQVDPGFVDTAAYDFHLKPGSPLIDAGMFLTRTAGAGSGTTMTLADASYFRDGYGIDGLGGDTIQLEGGSARAAIVAVDYARNTITLDTPLAWSDGARVSLKYNGSAPDIGALEGDAPSSGVATDRMEDDPDLYSNPTNGRYRLMLW